MWAEWFAVMLELFNDQVSISLCCILRQQIPVTDICNFFTSITFAVFTSFLTASFIVGAFVWIASFQPEAQAWVLKGCCIWSKQNGSKLSSIAVTGFVRSKLPRTSGCNMPKSPTFFPSKRMSACRPGKNVAWSLSFHSYPLLLLETPSTLSSASWPACQCHICPLLPNLASHPTDTVLLTLSWPSQAFNEALHQGPFSKILRHFVTQQCRDSD